VLFVISIDIVIMTSGLTPVLFETSQKIGRAFETSNRCHRVCQIFQCHRLAKIFFHFGCGRSEPTKGAHSAHGQHQTGNHLVPFGQNESMSSVIPIQTPMMLSARDSPLACRRPWLLAVLTLGSNGSGCVHDPTEGHYHHKEAGLQSCSCCIPLPGSTGSSTS